jgi:hypothetical protein
MVVPPFAQVPHPTARELEAARQSIHRGTNEDARLLDKVLRFLSLMNACKGNAARKGHYGRERNGQKKKRQRYAENVFFFSERVVL